MAATAALQFVAPAVWPLGHLLGMALLPPPSASAQPAEPPARAKPVAAPLDHVGVILATTPKLAVAMLAWWFAPLAVHCATLAPGWVSAIAARDVAITWLTAGVWCWLLYDAASPFHAALAARKLNPAPPAPGQLTRERTWATVSTLISTALEVGLLWLWASDAAGTTPAWAAPAARWLALSPGWAAWFPGVSWWRHAPTVAWIVTMPYVRIVHFFCIHRMMHPW